jgi:hypothetical protein
MDISKFSEQEIAELQAQLDARRDSERRKREEDIETYRSMIEQFCDTTFSRLNALSGNMREAKDRTFADAEALIRMKESLYNVKVDRHSNTFTSKDGISITVGCRTNEGWDDTVDAGIEKVKEFLSSLAKDEDSAKLYDIVMRLLAKDRKGNLKAQAMLQLEQYAAKFNDPIFSEGVKIIRDSYRPVETCQFISVKYKDSKGRQHSLPLSLAAMSNDGPEEGTNNVKE